MTDYRIRFNNSMGNITCEQISDIEDFLKGTIKTNFGEKENQWIVSTARALTFGLVNTALAMEGILNRDILSIDEI